MTAMTEDEKAHYARPDDGKADWAKRGAIYSSWRRHQYKLVSHHACGFHMQRIGPCNGECNVAYGRHAYIEHGTTGYCGKEGVVAEGRYCGMLPSDPVHQIRACEEFICISERAIEHTLPSR